jgi:2-amino-4-hydroxy-6-hydroxymethyldihydropteridine diphosphokinase
VLSIGSNLGDRLTQLQAAVDGLGSAVRSVSPVYETAPWGPVAQDDYLNAILLVDDDGLGRADAEGAAGARDWLRWAEELERRAGRTRTVRFGPRTLDVDVITVDGVRSDDARLTLPHPRAHERAFVLVPWLAVSAGAVLPGRGSVADLVAGLEPDETAGVRRREDLMLTVGPQRPGAWADRSSS